MHTQESTGIDHPFFPKDYRYKRDHQISGIGIDDGNALMVKAGYSGSGLNDVIWMGEVVNSACHLANKAGRGWRKNVLISEKVYENISKDVQDYFSKCQIDSKTYYESDIVWSEYEDWIEQNYN